MGLNGEYGKINVNVGSKRDWWMQTDLHTALHTNKLPKVYTSVYRTIYYILSTCMVYYQVCGCMGWYITREHNRF